MKKILIAVSGLVMVTAFGLFIPETGSAGISVNINIPLPGPVIPAPPPMVVIPGTYVYYPPDAGVDIFFYQGYWYRPYNGGWYIAGGYNGPWRTVAPGRVPAALFNVPRGYRSFGGSERMPYSAVRKNWRGWERDRHWDKGGHGRGEHGHGGGEGGRGGEHGRGHGRG